MNTLLPPDPTSRPRAPQRGFTMIEVLVVILVLSFGMLGIAGLQALTAKYKINSWARAAAAEQFGDLADRMRANPSVTGLSFEQTGAAASTSQYVLDTDWATQQAEDLSIATDCLATACTATERATYDMLIWRSHIRQAFPQGAAIVSGNRAAGVNATIAWFDREFVKADGTADNSASCAAGDTGATQVNCCPTELGDPAPGGVRCTNLSFVP